MKGTRCLIECFRCLAAKNMITDGATESQRHRENTEKKDKNAKGKTSQRINIMLWNKTESLN